MFLTHTQEIVALNIGICSRKLNIGNNVFYMPFESCVINVFQTNHIKLIKCCITANVCIEWDCIKICNK